jgi:hypothetical protein
MAVQVTTEATASMSYSGSPPTIYGIHSDAHSAWIYMAHLQQENLGLRGELSQIRTEYTTLGERWRSLLAQFELAVGERAHHLECGAADPGAEPTVVQRLKEMLSHLSEGHSAAAHLLNADSRVGRTLSELEYAIEQALDSVLRPVADLYVSKSEVYDRPTSAPRAGRVLSIDELCDNDTARPTGRTGASPGAGEHEGVTTEG